MKLLITICSLIALTGCASKPLTKEEQAVRYIRKSDAPDSCSRVGRVNVGAYETITEDMREEHLKKRAYALGGNLVVLDRDEQLGVGTSGTAYKCP